MLDLRLNTQHGSFHLQVECRFASEWTVIFGPSGAGKSTLLRLLAGLDRERLSRSSQTRIVFDSAVLSDTGSSAWLKPGQRGAALVAQQPALFPHLSVAANVAYGLRGLDQNSALRALKRCWSWLEPPPSSIVARATFLEERPSVSRLPELWRLDLGCCCLMSRFPRWMVRRATRCSRAFNSGYVKTGCRQF